MNIDQTRNDFEAWVVENCHSDDDDFVKKASGEYKCPFVESHWQLYQAATAKAKKRLEIAVGALRLIRFSGALRPIRFSSTFGTIAEDIATNALKEIESA